MNQFELSGLLPMPPWLGPPLPRFIGLLWPWANGENGRRSQAPEILYQNAEELEVVRGPDGTIQRVIRHIKVTRNG